jgi:MFS transporter, Spinster family, sphingosine-1-phosphate transporter
MSASYQGRPGRQWWLVAVLTGIATLGGIDRQIMALLIEPIRADMGLTDTEVSLIYGAAFALANVLFLIPAGVLADRIDRRKLLVAGLALWSLGTMACGLVGSYLALFAARALVGGGESVLQPAALSMLRSGVDAKRLGRAYSTYAMAIMLGTALAMAGGGAIIGFLAHRGSLVVPAIGTVRPWQITLFLLGVLGIPAGLLLGTVREPAKPAPRPENSGFAAALRFLGDHGTVFVPLLLFNAVAGMLTLSYGAWVTPILLRSWHYSLAEVGARLGIMMLVVPPIGLFAMGWVVDRLSRRHGAIGVAYAGMGAIVALTVTSVAVPLMPDRTALWIAMVFALLTSGTCFPITNTILARLVPAECLGRVSAVQYLVYGVLGAAIGPTVVAAVSDRVFSGPDAIGQALAVTCTGYGTVALICLILALRPMARMTDLQAQGGG